MAEPIPTLPGRMTREEYYRWAEAQPRGRFELVDGKVVAMAPEQIQHAEAKAMAWLLLRQAVAAAGLPCRALPDGVSVVVDDSTVHEPDALVDCGERPDRNAVAAPNPVVVVEVLSPGTRSVDTGIKLTDYFRVPSIRHYLIVHLARRVVIHHRRLEDGRIESGVLASGPITLDPPGLTISVEALFEA